ncbi:glycosyltransferase [Herbiconiux sp. A18JL235]|uniref:Glycosyltransferase n=1 Tax=Herbiconiux sp. A18JL235 TaxID=3152363 RepID=A0AB39BCR2_9MICO
MSKRDVGPAEATYDARSRPRDGRSELRLWLLRLIVLASVVLAYNYVIWRWLESVNWSAWWIAVPLVVAESYSVIDVTLFGLTMWRARTRSAPPQPAPDATVDVFIATYNEPVELVSVTAAAAKRIRWPHETWILDDGDRPEMRAAAEELGVGYITRGREWSDRPRHAKAGNINNALMETTGEFLLILDADMIPRPEILDHTLGYFRDPEVALVQTPQVFSNVATGDPLGSQAPLFYGPIQEGKDGWNAAFFCGSNAVLRREALMQLGIVGYVREVEAAVARTLRDAFRIVRRAQRRAPAGSAAAVALAETATALLHARQALGNGEPLAEVTYSLQRRVDAAAAGVVFHDLRAIQADLAAIAGLPAGPEPRPEGGPAGDSAAGSPLGPAVGAAGPVAFDPDEVLASLATRDLSPLNALEAVQLALRAVDIDRDDEAQAVMPLATISVTEDMATSMRMHGLGWRSVFHKELLADGLAPEDLSTALTQRLRWAQGTMQVFLRENPLFSRGMTAAQRLMYFSTMWSYLSGFATIVYLAAPVIFLVFGVLPVDSWAPEFFWHFLPFFIVNQLLFLVAARGLPTWRGQQYSLALFPVWIRACVSAFGNVVFRLPLDFAVTPKTKQAPTGVPWRKLRWQLIAAVVLVIAVVVGIIRVVVLQDEFVGTVVNVVWVAYDLLMLSVLVGAVRYRGYVPDETVAAGGGEAR